jgi:signal transduction histidine kinase
VRLSVLYAALFLAAGALLLALTYGLVASSLPRTTSLSKLTSTQEAQLNLDCKRATQAASAKSKGAPQPHPVPGACNKLASESANAATANQRDQALHNLLLFSLLGLGAMTLASGGLGWVMAGRVLRPVSTITEAARRASERHLGERLDLQGPRDELKNLADTFDEMLDRLDIAFATQQRFVADASHELRTPLTVMKTAIDVTLAKPQQTPAQLQAMATKVRRSVDQAERLIESLLTLAVSEHAPFATEFIDLATVAEDAVDGAGPDIASLRLEVKTSFEPAEVYGGRSLVERLVGNLVDNAARHNIAGGWIDVTTGRDAEAAYVHVSNSGPPIDEEVVQSLFEPFRRIEERTNGSRGVGLGLAIVRSIVTAHKGAIDVHSRPEGGLTISISLPAQDRNPRMV